jgi:hypothetical protein
MPSRHNGEITFFYNPVSITSETLPYRLVSNHFKIAGSQPLHNINITQKDIASVLAQVASHTNAASNQQLV